VLKIEQEKQHDFDYLELLSKPVLDENSEPKFESINALYMGEA
jgi:hypothetical protein